MRCTWVGGSGLTHELVCYEPRERAIQRSRPQTHSAIGELVHKTHHGVPMALTRSQCKQHLKPRRSQCRGSTCRTHTQTIQSSLDMTEMDISDLGTQLRREEDIVITRVSKVIVPVTDQQAALDFL